ncbi:hypothetical protein GTGU_03406 [Trabulsiella guamensis ATCC 49490]|uniref:Uncharacterized protein n=1 Tax=Trabulsiella guamensis ATCC 49490 TaxID=1005994 RepID=A0A084ZZ86_9ENTR|nr:hypothetical protein GTGU_03406 [Trabulsiella guamensis ATCC 49490]
MSAMSYRRVPALTRIQDDLYAEAPVVVGRLPGIKEVKIKAVAVGKHHNMGCPPYVWHHSVIVFHDMYLSLIN